ncbi:alpha/beta fold hydrolase [Woeseia oceani]|uniref:AB hydrolase-1 domain-containing protein n=1 Tax=Woeseia oceani TaxID=1548547 RepID=A0A193LIE9_9GAMM|nr:alpha/beta hydrolase [Woeseia oceani]ANO52277.1 hypothetical protein BA177_14745 [Woeseia oceani]
MSSFPAAQILASNGIELAVHEAGTGPAVLLLHGFPELAYSWRHQLPALAAAGYRAIAPDLRGYGQSSRPEAVEEYRIECLIDDMTGLLAALELKNAVIAAHDWGALLAWQMALLRPDLVRGLICLNIPFLPRGRRDPIAVMREHLGPEFYIVNFQDSDEADRRLAEDPRNFINRMMRRDVISRAQFDALPAQQRVISLLATLDKPQPRGNPLLTPEELDYYTAAFAKSGFAGAINWYRNWSHNWRVTEHVKQVVTVPTLFIGAENDVVVQTKQIEAMKSHVPDLEMHMLTDCGHWTQQEQPAATNQLMLDWLARRFPN